MSALLMCSCQMTSMTWQETVLKVAFRNSVFQKFHHTVRDIYLFPTAYVISLICSMNQSAILPDMREFGIICINVSGFQGVDLSLGVN